MSKRKKRRKERRYIGYYKIKRLMLRNVAVNCDPSIYIYSRHTVGRTKHMHTFVKMREREIEIVRSDSVWM